MNERASVAVQCSAVQCGAVRESGTALAPNVDVFVESATCCRQTKAGPVQSTLLLLRMALASRVEKGGGPNARFGGASRPFRSAPKSGTGHWHE